MPSKFSYHSEQVHSIYENGKGMTRKNLVKINNGKGHKAVETYDVKGHKLNSAKKALTPKEITCIKKGQFIPGLFRDCVKPLKANMRSLKTLKRRRSH